MGVIEQVRSPLPEGVEEYAGRWVAIRGGRIVAAADTLEELFENDRVRQTDVVYRVPERGTYFF